MRFNRIALNWGKSPGELRFPGRLSLWSHLGQNRPQRLVNYAHHNVLFGVHSCAETRLQNTCSVGLLDDRWSQ